jgi:glycosyltransferase involved in cell wall biosynthesis
VKILHVVNSLDPGGMENGIVNMARALDPRGFEIHVACLERSGAFAARLPHPERVCVLGKSRGFSPGAVLRLAREILRLKPAVLHSHNLGALIYSSLADAGGLLCPLLQGEHSLLTPEERKPRRLRQRRWLYHTCRAIHTVSHPMRHELLALGLSAEKISVIQNGVDTLRFAPGDRIAARNSMQLPPDSLCIGIVGRFGPFKRHGVLIDAFERIAANFPSARLVIVGSGGSEESATHAHAKGSPHAARIDLAGFQSEPSECYRALDLLVIPSSNEGLSNAALEAMATGIPVLAHLGCGHEQIIDSGRDGVIADLSTPDTLAARLTELLSEPARLIDFGRNARTKMEAKFSIHAMADAYEQLYRSLASPSR